MGTKNSILLYNLNLREEDNLSTKDKACAFILFPTFRGFTVSTPVYMVKELRYYTFL